MITAGHPAAVHAAAHTAVHAADSLVVARRVRCGEASYDYAVYTPDARTPLPAVLLLHGAHGRAADLLDAWRPLAARERIALVAPQLPSTAAFEAVAPMVFRCVVHDAERAVAVDAGRVYLFGYSMGGYLAFDGGLLASDTFAGTAVYAAAIADDYTALVDSAARRRPFALYIGDRDPFYSVAQVRRTRDLLTAHGFPVRYVEIPDQDHGYAPVATRVNADAWAYLRPYRLSDTARAGPR
ncbi:MAG TPA: alpha/beta fold hydrolase [Gemmatirosa sp.]